MSKMVFALVHPAWHGGWCWRKVVPLLQERGHIVLTPTLTGLGERSHLLRADIDLETHVADVMNVVKYEDLRDVVLVGHSSSGAVITGVADQIPERIGHIVYLDAFVPANGQSILELLAPQRRRSLEELVQSEGDGWLLPRFAPVPWERIVREMWGVSADEDVRWMLERLGPTPIGHFKDPCRRTNPAAEKLPRTYIRCTQFQSARFDEHAELAKKTAGWRYRELLTSHHPAITSPRRVADLLLEL